MFEPITFPNEPHFITPTWDELNTLAFKIAQEMRADGKKFDRIVTLAKGGWPMTRSLVDYLQVDQVASIGVKFYSGINQRLDKPEIYQDIPVDLKGESVLLFDDVADTGESLIFVKEYLLEKGVASVTTATLFYKPHSHIKPDYYGAETSAWILFPYDAVESITTLGKKWLDRKLSTTEITQRFHQLGFSSDCISHYFSGINI